MAGSQTEVATGELLVAGLLAGRTLSSMAMVRLQPGERERERERQVVHVIKDVLNSGSPD